jgi:hypothetical protein
MTRKSAKNFWIEVKRNEDDFHYEQNYFLIIITNNGTRTLYGPLTVESNYPLLFTYATGKPVNKSPLKVIHTRGITVKPGETKEIFLHWRWKIIPEEFSLVHVVVSYNYKKSEKLVFA